MSSPSSSPSNLASNHAAPLAALGSILSRIEAARKSALRPAAATKLIAVSKTQPVERIIPLLEAGQRCFGENRVQEAEAKWPDLRAATPDLELHLIGPLQSNKAAEAVALFDVIHVLDRPKLAEALQREMQRQNKQVQIFVQVNTGEEAQKAGLAPRDLDGFISLLRNMQFPVSGLMCIPPVDQVAAPHFALLAKLAAQYELPELSMGMSDDFESAIRFGATMVRVGSAIFGQR